jgi:hypothetical protein
MTAVTAAVMASGYNLAMGKQAYASSALGAAYVAGAAVDGRNDTIFHCSTVGEHIQTPARGAGGSGMIACRLLVWHCNCTAVHIKRWPAIPAALMCRPH